MTLRRPGAPRGVLPAAVLLGILLGLLPAAAPSPAAAATPGLTLVGATTYDVRPDEGRVAVTVRLSATNHLKNTVTKRYFFRTATLTVLPGTSGFKLKGSSGSAKVSVTKKTSTYTNIKLDFGANLAAGKSTTLTLTFDLKDPGGAPARTVRISPSIATFAAWAYATPGTPGATVDVRLPTGYTVTVGRGPLDGPTPDGAGHERWSSGKLAKPLEFVADIAADKPSDFADTPVDVALEKGPAAVVVRAWPDDTAWRDRVIAIVQEALPVLERDIGVPWPVDGSLALDEALVRSTGGYAALYAPSERRIEIAYSASDGVILHELAHAWFNGALVADRWAAEGFASYYAERAAAELKIKPDAPAAPADPQAGVMPLNAWGPIGSGTPATDIYAYAASVGLAEEIATRAGPDALQRVWSLAAARVGAYQATTAAQQDAAPNLGADGPVGVGSTAVPEAAEGPPDWRGLLDLLEDTTGKDFGDAWRDVVARPVDLAALDARTAARSAYHAAVATAGDWVLPPGVRAAMRSWQFESAQSQLEDVDAVMTARRTLETSAASAQLALPGRLRAAFEGEAGVDAAVAEAKAEQAVVDAIVRARSSRPAETGVGEQLITQVGLLGATPEADVDGAAASLAAGDIEVAYAAALQAEAAWSGAPRVGRSRIVSTALLLVALILLIGLVRQQRRRRGAAGPEPG
ncbi:MAG TPA: hypothetical protein VHR16_03360 [Candidatus Limnocylindrales bacterium]|nr:hypothetical protein [Candidatus Limnocylindrales bacterium]